MVPREVIGGAAARRRRIGRRSGLVRHQESAVAPESLADTAKAEFDKEKDTFLQYPVVVGGPGAC